MDKGTISSLSVLLCFYTTVHGVTNTTVPAIFRSESPPKENSTKIYSTVSDDFNEEMVDHLKNIGIEKKRSQFLEEHNIMATTFMNILNQTYILRQAEFRVRLGVLNLFIQYGKYCVQYFQNQGVDCIGGTDLSGTGYPHGVTISYNENSFFNTFDVFPRENTHFDIGGQRISTTSKFAKFRVANHLGNKIYFIGFQKITDLSGTLFAADLKRQDGDLSDYNIIATEVDLGTKFQVINLAVNQYNGYIFIYAPEYKLYILEKVPFAGKLGSLYENLYSNDIWKNQSKILLLAVTNMFV